jgi:hypothetical protein
MQLLSKNKLPHQLDISVMLTPVLVILIPFAVNDSKNRWHDKITFFFSNFLLFYADVPIRMENLRGKKMRKQ